MILSPSDVIKMLILIETRKSTRIYDLTTNERALEAVEYANKIQSIKEKTDILESLRKKGVTGENLNDIAEEGGGGTGII